MSSLISGIASFISGILAIFGLSVPGVDAPQTNPSATPDPVVSAAESTHEGDTYIHGGESAVQRQVYLLEQEAGHDLFSVKFTGDHSATIQLAETFSYETDKAALDKLMSTLKLDGYTDVSMLAAPVYVDGDQK